MRKMLFGDPHPMRAIVGLVGIVLLVGVLSSCESAASKADRNLTKAADNFEVPRRITAINGITDKVLFTVEGFCNYETSGKTLKVLCKEPGNKVERTTLGLSDNVTFVVAQLGGVKVDLFRSRIIFRPESIIPNFDLSTRAHPTEGNEGTLPSPSASPK